MHEQGITHRDIKPANMLLNEDYEIRINDFGFATFLKPDRGQLVSILGTPEYEAPELILEQVYDGPKVDIFAAGVSLFNIFTGKPAFDVANPKKPKDYPLYNLIAKRDNKYWAEISQKYWAIKNPDDLGLFSPNFKSLMFGMLASDVNKRQTIEEIKKHAWWKGECSTKEEMQKEFMKRTGPMKYSKRKQECEKIRKKEAKKPNFRRFGNKNSQAE